MTKEQAIEALKGLTEVDVSTNCHLFKGQIDDKGYGRLWIGDKKFLAHRISAFIHHNLDLDSDLQANHKNECPNRNCINPEHVYVGSQKDNINDAWIKGTFVSGFGAAKASRTHCPQGHEYTFYGGRKRCRICTLTKWNRVGG